MQTLKENVQEWMEEKVSDGYDECDAIEELLQNGCQSGMVGHLIYYHDTLKFFTDHKSEINALLTETMEQIGCESPTGLFGDKWDNDDPLAMDTSNQNLLAWFGFEETARNLAHELGFDL